MEANPGRVNDRDSIGRTALYSAVWYKESLSLIVRLLDDKGTDVNGTDTDGHTPLHAAQSLDVLNALLDHGADPTLVTTDGWSVLMHCAMRGEHDSVARLLEAPHVRATVGRPK